MWVFYLFIYYFFFFFDFATLIEEAYSFSINGLENYKNTESWRVAIFMQARREL